MFSSFLLIFRVRQVDTPPARFHSIAVGVQHDSSSCGFWAAIFAFALALDIPIQDGPLIHLSPARVKELLATLYGDFISAPHGITADTLSNALGQFNPGRTIPTGNQIVCVSQSQIVPSFTMKIQVSPCPPGRDRYQEPLHIDVSPSRPVSTPLA
jgi:hypothetical protein